MTKVTVAYRIAPARTYGAALYREAVQQFASDLHQKEFKRLIISFLSRRRETRFHGFRGPSHPPSAVLSRILLADCFTSPANRHVPSGALRPKFDFDFRFDR
jgi:hypothetical protein